METIDLRKKRKKLFRSKSKRIAGVCGGLAIYFNTDVSLIRTTFLLGFIFTGLPLFAYIIMWLTVPMENNNNEEL